jgi:hypothetical protein
MLSCRLATIAPQTACEADARSWVRRVTRMRDRAAEDSRRARHAVLTCHAKRARRRLLRAQARVEHLAAMAAGQPTPPACLPALAARIDAARDALRQLLDDPAGPCLAADRACRRR